MLVESGQLRLLRKLHGHLNDGLSDHTDPKIKRLSTQFMQRHRGPVEIFFIIILNYMGDYVFVKIDFPGTVLQIVDTDD